MKESVAVIGAGVAGLIAAKNLTAAGIETTVYDQKTVLGYPPVASGIISIKGLDSLGIDYGKAITNTLYGANLHAGKEVMHIRAREPKAYVLDRQHLNELCLEEATKAGAKFIRKKIGSEDLEALSKDHIIIGADGALSTVAKHFGMGTINRYALTYKAEFAISASDPSTVDLFFDNSVTPKFFGWFCPNSKSVLEVGIGLDSKHGNSKSTFDRFVKQNASGILSGARMLSGHASIIPLETARKIVDAKKRVLLVGDAAGQVKPTTGGGIVFGGNAAIMAAKVIADHIRRGSPLSDYERLFRKRYGFDIRLHGFLRNVYASLDRNRMGYAIKIMNSFGAESFFSAYGDMDSPSAMVKRFFLRGFGR